MSRLACQQYATPLSSQRQTFSDEFRRKTRAIGCFDKKYALCLFCQGNDGTLTGLAGRTSSQFA
jgi:hypothetical protein